MKDLIIATTIALALAGVGNASATQNQAQTTNMQNVTVTQVPAQYETYVTDLNTGFKFQALVGNAHRQYAQALRAAEKSESLRKKGLATQPIVAVAIDNSSGTGVARRIQLINSAHETIAFVNVYCKRSVSSGSAHCRFAPILMRITTDNQRLASIQTGAMQLVQVDLHH